MAASATREHVAHHFEDAGQQHDAATLGMWVFLATELMVFGGLFAGYTVYRVSYPEAFKRASQELNVMFGAVNTLVLLTSSLTMALAVWSVQTNRRRPLTYFLAATVALGTTFLVVKGFEYYEDYGKGLMPFLPGNFNPDKWKPHREPAEADWEPAQREKAPANSAQPRKRGAGEDPENHDPGTRRMPIETHVAFPDRVKLFFSFYYVMTGLHALHLIIGITWLVILTLMAGRGRFSAAYYFPVEVAGLYWHFVDVVWIFLLPLLYLVGTAHWHH